MYVAVHAAGSTMESAASVSKPKSAASILTAEFVNELSSKWIADNPLSANALDDRIALNSVA
ncbi:hypothetical protein [Rhodobacter capsulatus]|uniref:hypothetical protein n=1 Tax=Rhodobacter capsulatus TaxID=1061 RepID=UPI00146A4A07|nr:hypothetical protein [Rhodobacter capsulatus]